MSANWTGFTPKGGFCHIESTPLLFATTCDNPDYQPLERMGYYIHQLTETLVETFCEFARAQRMIATADLLSEKRRQLKELRSDHT